MTIRERLRKISDNIFVGLTDIQTVNITENGNVILPQAEFTRMKNEIIRHFVFTYVSLVSFAVVLLIIAITT